MDVRIGARFRALRQRLGWRQVDLARKAGVSQSLVSLLERGHLDRLSVDSLRRIAQALDADLFITLRWRGGDLDRLVDEGHATLVGTVADLLQRAGWLAKLEASYSIYGERGSIDVLAWHPVTRMLLVVEVKTEITNLEETLRKHDEKGRLGPRVAAEQLGWQAQQVGRLLVMPEGATARRRIQRLSTAMDLAYPRRGADARRWLAKPDGAAACLLFVKLPLDAGRRSSLSRKRIRRNAMAA